MKSDYSNRYCVRGCDRDLRKPNPVRKLRSVVRFCVRALVVYTSVVSAAIAQEISLPEPQTAIVVGTVLDVIGDPVPGAAVNLEGPLASDHLHLASNENGFFEMDHLRAGTAYHITVSANGFADWTSPAITLKPGEFQELTGIRLSVAEVVTTVHAIASTEEIATEQVEIEEHQRVLGIIPNFYAVYDRQPAPLTPKLKFRLALRAMIDPVTFLGAATVAGMDQAADKFDFQQGTKGYFQRFGASYTNGFTDIMVGGAILPSILHQDPRYFYKGTGTTKSRLLHAISYPVITRGDNGHLQPNYSSIGGYLVSGAISNAYYPASNRGAGLVLNTALVDIGTSMANGILQEFVLRRLTPSAKEQRLPETGGN